MQPFSATGQYWDASLAEEVETRFASVQIECCTKVGFQVPMAVVVLQFEEDRSVRLQVEVFAVPQGLEHSDSSAVVLRGERYMERIHGESERAHSLPKPLEKIVALQYTDLVEASVSAEVVRKTAVQARQVVMSCEVVQDLSVAEEQTECEMGQLLEVPELKSATGLGRGN